jgi:3-oxoacyl-[acyl-carrier protein] reductase
VNGLFFMHQIDVRNRVVMITGAGQGIGRTYAKEFALAGARVGLVEINEAAAEAVAAEIRAEGGQAISACADVCNPTSVDRAVQQIRAAFGDVAVLINNAAIFVTLGRQAFDAISLSEWEQVLRVNVTGSWVCASAVAAGMRKVGWGRIINVSSSTVPLGAPMFCHYVTSKAAVIGMTRAMAKELGPHGVTVNCLLPGLTETEVDNPGRSDAMRQKVVEMQAVKRLGRPEDMVGTVMYLASPISSFMTGQSILVDGGMAFI